MKIYDALNVTISYASLGNNLTIFLSGCEEDILSCFNGLYNLKACRPSSRAGNCLTFNESKTIGTFNSSEDLMFSFFYNLSQMRGQSDAQSKEFATSKMEEFKTTQVSSERFTKSNNFSSYSTGNIVAERPDESFADAIISDSFRPREKENSEDLELV